MTEIYKDTIIKGRDNEVVFVGRFTGDFQSSGFAGFDEIRVTVGDETYSTISDPENLYVENKVNLKLKIGAITSLDVGTYIPKIVGFSGYYPNGVVLSSVDYNQSSPVSVVVPIP